MVSSFPILSNQRKSSLVKWFRKEDCRLLVRTYTFSAGFDSSGSNVNASSFPFTSCSAVTSDGESKMVGDKIQVGELKRPTIMEYRQGQTDRQTHGHTSGIR